MKVLVIGSCQANVFAKILKLIAGLNNCDVLSADKIPDQSIDSLMQYKLVFLQNPQAKKYQSIFQGSERNCKVVMFPRIVFFGHHPDYLCVKRSANSQMAGYHSKIILMAYANKVPRESVPRLFSREFIEKLNYSCHFGESKKWLIENLDRCGMDGSFFFQKWHASAPFVHTSNHPKLFVMEDVTKFALEKAGLEFKDVNLSMLMNDPLKEYAVFPSYHRDLHLPNSMESLSQIYKQGQRLFSLEEFIEYKYTQYEQIFDNSIINESKNTIFKQALAQHSENISLRAIKPYAELPNTNFGESR